MINMLHIIYIIGLISIGIAVFSGFRMLYFLKMRGLEKSSIYSFNPDIFIRYCEITKHENGSTGIWFKIALFSFIVAGICIILLFVFSVFN